MYFSHMVICNYALYVYFCLSQAASTTSDLLPTELSVGNKVPDTEQTQYLPEWLYIRMALDFIRMMQCVAHYISMINTIARAEQC